MLNTLARKYQKILCLQRIDSKEDLYNQELNNLLNTVFII